MTEDEAKELLDRELDRFTEDVREVIHRKIHDQIDIERDLINDKAIKQVVLGWIRRIYFETVHDEFGENYVAFEFNNSYFQISAQKIGPEDFSKEAKPYKE